MELRHLATFREVATARSFSRAAALLGYAQSSVTVQIQALEAELGVRLFDRLGRRVALTDAGQRLLRYAEDLLRLAEEARSAVAADAELAGRLTVGAPGTVCAYRLPNVLGRFRARFPRVRLILRQTPGPELRRLVSDGTLDLAIAIGEPVRSTGLVVEPLVAEPLLVLARPDHPLTRAHQVGPDDLERESLLLTGAGCSYRALFTRTLAAAGVHPTLSQEFDSVEAIKQCAIAGLGIAALPSIAVGPELEQGQLVALRWAGDDLRVVTQAVWHRAKSSSPPVLAFLDVARETLAAADAA